MRLLMNPRSASDAIAAYALLQLAFFSIAAVYSAFYCVRWLPQEGKSKMLKQLTSLCLVVFVSSVFGGVSIVMAMKMFDYLEESKATGITAYEQLTKLSSSLRFRAAFMIIYQIQNFLVCCSKIVLLARLSANASKRVRYCSVHPAVLKSMCNIFNSYELQISQEHCLSVEALDGSERRFQRCPGKLFSGAAFLRQNVNFTLVECRQLSL
jgi:hypothetical protein